MKTDELENLCERIFELRQQKKQIEQLLATHEKEVKDHLVAEGLTDMEVGRLLVHIKTTPPSMIVDTAKLKADGLFEKYSKQRAGSQSLMLTERQKSALQPDMDII